MLDTAATWGGFVEDMILGQKSEGMVGSWAQGWKQADGALCSWRGAVQLAGRRVHEPVCLAKDEVRDDRQGSEDEAAVPAGLLGSLGLSNCQSFL